MAASIPRVECKHDGAIDDLSCLFRPSFSLTTYVSKIAPRTLGTDFDVYTFSEHEYPVTQGSFEKCCQSAGSPLQ